MTDLIKRLTTHDKDCALFIDPPRGACDCHVAYVGADAATVLEAARVERTALTSRLLASRHVCDELKADLAALQSRLEAALADQRRLDFLETHGLGVDYFPHMTWDCWHGGVRYVGESPRAAIDAAIAQEQKRD